MDRVRWLRGMSDGEYLIGWCGNSRWEASAKSVMRIARDVSFLILWSRLNTFFTFGGILKLLMITEPSVMFD